MSPLSSGGTSLPLSFTSPSPAPPREPKPVHSRLSARPQRRSAEACRSGDGYAREKFCPGPTSRFLKRLNGYFCENFQFLTFFFFVFLGDLEKEKRRLQNIMSTGQEEDTPVASNRDHEPDTEETDRFQEGTNDPVDKISNPRASSMAVFLSQSWVRLRRDASFWLIWSLWARDRNTGTSSTRRFLR